MTDKEIYEETLYQLRARAWGISNDLMSKANKIKDLIEDSTKEKKFLNLSVSADSVKNDGEQLSKLDRLSVAIYRKENGYKCY